MRLEQEILFKALSIVPDTQILKLSFLRCLRIFPLQSPIPQLLLSLVTNATT